MQALLRIAVAALFALFLALPVHAVQPDEVLADPALEARARALSQGLRCLVCQNQSIDDSDAGLARDLRLLLRERLKAGDTDAAAVDYIVARYGTYVLLNPPMQTSTLVLWLAPLLLLGLAGAGFYRHLQRQATGAAGEALTRDEEERVTELLRDDGKT
jgi:cytochrome c-type biogenesis protein CcmH